MFLLRKPSADFIRNFLLTQVNEPFSYPNPGATREESAPRSYLVDHHRVRLGTGESIYEQASLAIRQWKMFDIAWVQLCWPDTPIQKGASVAVLAAHAGFWSLNPCRVVYALEGTDPCPKCGFAYGTLPAHGERGEERFSVEFHRSDNSVWYDIYAFSRPRFPARMAYPYSRALQKRFAEDSMAAMRRAVASS